MRNPLMMVIFVICLLMFGILVAIGMADTVSNASGNPHPVYGAMNVGGDGALRLEHIGGLAFTFQCLLFLLIVCLCALSVHQRLRDPVFYSYLGMSLLGMLIVWWQMYFGHLEFLRTGETGYFMGFPVPTAWQIYGVWMAGIPLILIYSLGFRRYIYTLEDERKFEQLLQESQSTQQS